MAGAKRCKLSWRRVPVQHPGARPCRRDIGIGVRFDIVSFLTARFDVGIPVKEPYIHTNSGWVFNQIDFYNSSWRANNIIPVLTIGYPFLATPTHH